MVLPGDRHELIGSQPMKPRNQNSRTPSGKLASVSYTHLVVNDLHVTGTT